MSIRSSRRPRLAFGGALGIALLALVTACAPPGASPTADGAGSAGGSEASADPEKAFQDWQLAFAKCMRGEGVDMPDPGSDGSTQAIPMGDEAFSAAMETCMDRLGEPPSVDGRSDQEILDDQLATARCLREAGYDVEDPKAGQAMGIPADLPPDVIESCLPARGE